jgi:hypothetical protein
MNRHAIGPGDLALSEWKTAGLKVSDLAQIRKYRLERIRQHLQKFDSRPGFCNPFVDVVSCH